MTEMVQLTPTLRAAPQVLFWANWCGLVAAIPILVMLSGKLPLLVSVTVCAELVVPTDWFPKAMVAGVSETAGPVPVPVRLTLCGLPGALSVTVRLADAEKAAVGE